MGNGIINNVPKDAKTHLYGNDGSVDTGNARPLYSPYVEISLDNLLHNLAQVRSALPEGVGVMAVVKDCSYGCGSVMAAQALERSGGVKFFAVARAREAYVLRGAGVMSKVLVLGMTPSVELLAGAENDMLFALNDLNDLRRWKSYGRDVNFHLNIDTGMGRMGLLPSEMGIFIDLLKSAPNLRLQGVFTHMANSDEPNTPTVGRQVETFTNCIDKLRQADLNPADIHYGNTAALLRFPVKGCTLVRPGISLYGCRPDPAQDFGINLKPVASLISQIVKMKKVPAGTPVSYGGNYVTKEETWIATIALGYAHGLPRFLSNKGEVLIRGKRYRIAGNVTMDYIMVDAGAYPAVSIGDEAVALGTQGGETITADEIAVIGNTIGYEVLCNLGTSIKRFYVQNGKTVSDNPGGIF